MNKYRIGFCKVHDKCCQQTVFAGKNYTNDELFAVLEYVFANNFHTNDPERGKESRGASE